MSLYDFRFTLIIQELENETYLAEALFFPEVVRYGNDPGRLLDAIRRNASKIVEQLPLVKLHTRRAAEPPEIEEVTVRIDPPPRSLAWREPVLLRFPTIRWSHGEDAAIAYVPALGIEVPAKKQSDLHKLVPSHIKAQLLRTRAAASLDRLMWLQRCQLITLDHSSFTAFIRTPKQLATERDVEPRKSVLEEVAVDLTRPSPAEAFEIEELVDRVAEILGGRNPRSVLLVGPSGVGKTAAVLELVRRRRSLGLGNTPFWATSGSRLVAGMSGFGQWQERCGRLWREAKERKAILHLGNLIELMEVGKNVSSSQGIARFFRPHLARGDFLAIVECTPEQLPLVEREDPNLLNVFYQIKVEEPSRDRGRKILARAAEVRSRTRETVFGPDALDMLDRLHRRYATYSAYPGRPLRFLKNLLEDREDNTTLSAQEVISAFSRETGLPRFMLDDADPLDLDATRQWLCKRVIGQPEVIELIVDLLATLKAGLTRPRKPIASFLFIGPTGVGKTEMAKTLAEFLFHDRNRMTRFDMSEYADAISVGRLVGGVFGAEGLLTAKVREQPFAVILFDEFEKAHPLFFDLLLQVLGEGRLTDAAGRVADFSNAVVIMTSNLGAESFRRSSIGFSDDPDRAVKAREHFTREVRAFVRPELFNRIERIVPFAPLDEATVLEIALRELDGLAARDGLRFRRTTLTLAGEVAAWLAREGYDARYGARPLKRKIERELLVPLGEGLNSHAGNLALTADVRVRNGSLSVTVQPRLTESGKPVSAVVPDPSLFELATRCRALRSDIQRLERCPRALELRNELFRLERLEKFVAKRRRNGREVPEGLEQLPALRRIADHLKSATETIYALEDRILLALYGKADGDTEQLAGGLATASAGWRELLLSVCSANLRTPDYVTLAVFSENVESLFEMARVYYKLAVEAAESVSILQFAVQGEQKSNGDLPLLGRSVVRVKVARPKEFLASPLQTVIGIAMGLNVRFAQLLYGPERGVHVFIEKQKSHKCLVDTAEASLEAYVPPVGIERRASIAHQEKRRVYNYDRFLIEDVSLKAKLHFQARSIDQAVAWACEERMIRDARSMLETD